MEKVELVTLRNGTPDDRNFILATFLRGLYYGQSWFSEIDKDVFMRNYHKVITHILDSPKTAVIIACLSEDPTVILGYSLVKENGLHFVFVKSAWRGIGIAKSLVPNNTKFVTHLTKVGLSILKKKPGIKFNPFEIN